MSIAPGKHTLGPENGELLVRTGRTGGAAKAGHDLVIEVTSWNATLELAEDPARSSIALSADGGSLRVREGHGGISKLDDSDRQGITRTIDEEILKGAEIEFRSTAVESGASADQLRVRGELELAGTTRPVEFEVRLGQDGQLTGEATIRQSDWGMKPYSTLFGALKVADEVKVTVEADLPA
ncbi:MAG TPA: YceI family protein [Solirubrobacteraceae bacterium]